MKYKRGQNPNSQMNLRPGNPPVDCKGNGYSLTSALKHELAKDYKRTELVRSTIEGAIKREPTPFKEVWDRVEGKVPDKLLVAEVDVVFVIGKGYREKAEDELT